MLPGASIQMGIRGEYRGHSRILGWEFMSEEEDWFSKESLPFIWVVKLQVLHKARLVKKGANITKKPRGGCYHHFKTLLIDLVPGADQDFLRCQKNLLSLFFIFSCFSQIVAKFPSNKWMNQSLPSMANSSTNKEEISLGDSFCWLFCYKTLAGKSPGL